MKKLLSVVLLAVMLLGTFPLTGCDATLASLHNIIVLLTPTEAGPAVTTITKEDWDAAMEGCNFTTDAVNGDLKMHAEFTDTVIYQTVNNTASNEAAQEGYMAIIDGVGYSINDSGDGYVAREASFTRQTFGQAVSSMSEISDLNEIYDSLTYNSEDKSYHYENENFSMDIRFENGSIVTAHAVIISQSPQIVYDFCDFGTTVVELPGYTFASTDSQ